MEEKIRGMEARMGICLYHCRATNKDVQNFYEDTICLKSYLV